MLHVTSRPRLHILEGSRSWAAAGWLAGGLGALVVALFFLVVDLFTGRPLWTPTALGAALFLGQRIAADAAPVPALVAGYTGVHLGVFAGVGLLTTLLLSVHPHPRGAGGVLCIGVVLFAVFELFSGGFALLFAPSLLGALGAWRVSAANALAAAAMALFIGRVSGRLHPDVAG